MASRRRIDTIALQIVPASADQSAVEKAKKTHAAGFSWVASDDRIAAASQGTVAVEGRSIPGRQPWPKGLTHRSFASSSLGEDVGYCIYLPPSYDTSAPDWRAGRLNAGDRHYPVVYYLHGGRPGSELSSTGMASFFSKGMEEGTVPHAIYVFVNGGPLSHYNCEQSSSTPPPPHTEPASPLANPCDVATQVTPFQYKKHY